MGFPGFDLNGKVMLVTGAGKGIGPRSRNRCGTNGCRCHSE